MITLEVPLYLFLIALPKNTMLTLEAFKMRSAKVFPTCVRPTHLGKGLARSTSSGLYRHSFYSQTKDRELADGRQIFVSWVGYRYVPHRPSHRHPGHQPVKVFCSRDSGEIDQELLE